MPTESEALRALAAKWREESRKSWHPEDNPDALPDRRADELDALIATLPAEAGGVIHPETVAWNPARLKEDTAYRIAPLAEDGSVGSVERFTPDGNGSYSPMHPSPDGEYVRYSDYTRQQAENEGLREELNAVLSDWNAVAEAAGSPTNGGLVDHVAGLRQRLDLLSAEYATLADRSVEEQARVGSIYLASPSSPADRCHGQVDKAAYFFGDGKHHVRVVYWWTTEDGRLLRHTNFCEVAHQADAELLAALMSGKVGSAPAPAQPKSLTDKENAQ